MEETRREYYEKRKTALFLERSSFIPHYQELSRFIQPRMGRFFADDVNQGGKRHQSIINSTGTQAHRASRAGLFAGIMSPARPWFNLMTPDPDMMGYQPVLEWLGKVEALLNAIFQASNLYNMAPVLLGELLLFGTGSMSQVDDYDSVCRFYTHTAGSYALAQNDKYQVDTFVREFKMSARQMKSQFGDNVSDYVDRACDQGNYEQLFDVVHFVEPNSGNGMPWRSVYYEPGARKEDDLLSVKGFHEFPVHCPRWDVTAEDTYATDCPAMTALGDIKGLQQMEREKAKAIQKMVSPPLRGPSSLRNVPISSLPGGATLYDGGEANGKLEPIYTVMPQLQQMVLAMEHTEHRIKEAFYVDLFRSIDSMEGIQPQNQLFLSMKNAEKLLQLGPVLERLHGEFLNRLIDRTFAQCVRADILPPPPPELQGKVLKTRYVSALAMAQREVATQGIDKLTMFIGGLLQAGFGSAADNFDADDAVRVYAQSVGAPPKVIVDERKVADIRAKREQEAQQARQMAMMQQMAGAAQQGAGAVSDLAGAAATMMPQQQGPGP